MIIGELVGGWNVSLVPRRETPAEDFAILSATPTLSVLPCARSPLTTSISGITILSRSQLASSKSTPRPRNSPK